MEEVDAILISQLREIGCEIDCDVKTVAALDPIVLMKCTSECLTRILAAHTVAVPSASAFFAAMNMSMKYKLTTELATIIRDIGFKSDIGYQTFLYGNEHEVRRMLLFLVERIPRDEDNRVGLDLNDEDDSKNVVRALKRLNIGTVWIPHDSIDKSLPSYVPSVGHSVTNYDFLSDIQFSLNRFLKKSLSKPVQRYSKVALSQPDSTTTTFLPTRALDILEYNSRQSHRGVETFGAESLSPLWTKRSSQQLSSIDVQEIAAIENSAELSGEANVHQDQTAAASAVENPEDFYRSKLAEYKHGLQEYQTRITEHHASMEELEKCEQSYQNKCKLYEASCKSISELEENIRTLQTQIEELAGTWQEVQDDLYSQIDQLKSESMAKNSSFRDKLQRVAQLKKLIASKVKDLQTKEETVQDLTAKLPEDWPAGRSSYTKRILEIITNVAKQNAETKKVLLETKSIQKEINALNGKIARSFAVSEETIFRDAKQNDWNRRCYKTLALLHAAFDQLLECVLAVGAHLREIRHLEEIVENELERQAETNLTRINADLSQIQAENRRLEAQLAERKTV